MGRIFKLTPLLALMAIAGCETMQGAGRDMESAGQVLTQQSANAQTQMGQTPRTSSASPSVTPVPY